MAEARNEKQGSNERVKVQAEPRVCLHDSPTSIIVTGLTPHSPVTLTLTTHNDAGKRFHSFAHYLSDERGVVNVERSEAVGGAFMGVFPAGLFSNLLEYPFKHTRHQKEDPTTPWQMTLAAHEGHLTLEQSASSEGVASTLLERHIMGPGVRRDPVVHERVRGNLFLPAGPGPHPAIVDIFGGFGGLKEYRASMLASKGFACLAIAYFNYGDLPKTMETLDLEYLEEAVEYLLQQPGVIPDRCGVLSSSRGATLGLAMGIYLPKVTAVVCVGGMLVGDITMTYRGRELWKAVKLDTGAYHMDELNMATMNESVMKNLMIHDHPNMPPCETAPDDTHFLIIAGDQDGMCTSLAVEAMAQRMKLHGREDYCHTVVYSEAGHIIEPPYNTHAGYSVYEQQHHKIIFKWGGKPRGTCKAQEDNWQNMRKFLEMHVRERSTWYQQYVEQARGRTQGKL